MGAVPKQPRGYVRDLCVGWPLQDAGLPSRGEAAAFDDRDAAHIAHQPSGQVPGLADVLRLVDRFDCLADAPACRAYVARATARPAFAKAHADQMAHFKAADEARQASD